MENTTELIARFLETRWLANVGQPEPNAQVWGTLDTLVEAIEEAPESFFAPPYTNPYEAMCVEDHEAAARVEARSEDPRPKQVAKTAYLAAWARLPHPELCGLVSDDAHTIMALLIGGEPLRAFTAERMRWYEQGRVPWGYVGEFPTGRWLIL